MKVRVLFWQGLHLPQKAYLLTQSKYRSQYIQASLNMSNPGDVKGFKYENM